MKSLNKFQSGINTDTSIYEVDSKSLRSAVNVELMRPGNEGSLVNIRGTFEMSRLVENPASDFKVLGSVYARANIDIDCTGEYIFVKGVVYLVWDSNNGSAIKFHLPLNDTVYTVVSGDLGFENADAAQIRTYSRRDSHYIIWADGVNPLRSVELRLAGDTCYVEPEIRTLSLRPIAPQDCLELSEITDEGGLSCGTYFIMYRYYNKDTCLYSNWSTILGPVHIIPTEDACNASEVTGGVANLPANKSIKVRLTSSEGATGFDSIQFLVIKHTDGTKELPTVGYLLPPDETAYSTSTYTYTGLDKEIETSLDDVLIDDLAIISATTLKIQDGRVYAGNLRFQGFEDDNGDPTEIERAETITKKIGDAQNGIEPYQCESESLDSKGYFRGESYAYGLYYYDEHGNGIVFPLDLSGFNDTFTAYENFTTGTITSAGKLTTADPLQPGDRIQVAGYGATAVVTTYQSGVATLDNTSIPVGTSGQVDVLLGQKGNQKSHWAWTFGERSDNQLSLFDDDGDLNALGIRLTGIKNHPTWAKGFEVVRRKRIRDIIYQTPYIPCVAVQGCSTVGGDPNKDFPDYEGELDTVMPKVHRLGHARNIAKKFADFSSIGGDGGTSLYEYVEYEAQFDKVGRREISSMAFGVPPEYIYEILGESFDQRNGLGFQVDIADAVAYEFRQRIKEADRLAQHNSDYVENYFNRYASIFSAATRGHYLYNREGRHVDRGADVYQKTILELTSMAQMNIPEDFRITGQQDLPQNGPFISLPWVPFDSKEFDALRLYGNAGELAKQQKESNIVQSYYGKLFYDQVRNQKGVLWKLDDQLIDFSGLFVEGRAKHNDNYFPILGNWAPHQGVYDDLVQFDANNQLFLTINNLTDTPFIEFPGKFINDIFVPDGAIIGGAYVLNVRNGIGPERYGTIEAGGEWMRTGACQVLTASDIAAKTAFTIDVYGGDCFITKHSIKATDSNSRISMIDPLTEEMIQPLGSNRWVKTGAYEKHVEILDLYLESEVNGNYSHVDGRYPKKDDGNMSNYGGDWEYYYNPSFSDDNEFKVLIGKEEFCRDLDIWKASVAWSDRNVRGGVDTPYNEINGFKRFRVNNIWTLDGQFGEVRYIGSLQDKALHIFQDRKIAYQPIGVDELRTQDGVLVATGTGNVLGSGDYYLHYDFGTIFTHGVLEMDGRFIFLDSNRNALITMGSRGANWKVQSWGRFKQEMESYFVNEFESHEVKAFYEPKGERFVFYDTRGQGAYMFNLLRDFLETKLDVGSIQAGTWIETTSHLVNDATVWKFLRGHRSLVFGEPVMSEFSVLVNDHEHLSKVFQVIELNADKWHGTVEWQVFDEDSEHALISGSGVLDRHHRQQKYVQNVLRGVIDGKSQKLRGRALLVTFKLDGNYDKKHVIHSLVTSWRESF